MDAKKDQLSPRRRQKLQAVLENQGARVRGRYRRRGSSRAVIVFGWLLFVIFFLCLLGVFYEYFL